MVPSPLVIGAAQAAQRRWRIPASVSIAQYGLESAWGAKTTGSFNYFGIKARPGQPFTTVETHEWNGVKYIAEPQPFANFASMAEAFDAHARLLAETLVYAPAMGALPDVPAFVAAMARHYATAPTYAAQVMSIIRGDGLERYDLAA
jgi:flagellum-specific peptidoglycan hydrolase FlgJ